MSKFINDETKAYLDRRRKVDIESQLQNIRERIDIEANDFSNLIKNTESRILELHGHLGHLRTCAIEELDTQLKVNTAVKHELEDLSIKINRLLVAIVMISVGGLVWLIKSLI